MNVYNVSPTEVDEDLRQLRLRLSVATLFLLSVMLVGVIGYRNIDPGVGWVDAFYMTAITLTTVARSETPRSLSAIRLPTRYSWPPASWRVPTTTKKTS